MVPTKEAKTLGKKFKDRRVGKGLKLLFVADKLGIDSSHLSRFESGRRSLTGDLIAKYEDLLA